MFSQQIIDDFLFEDSQLAIVNRQHLPNLFACLLELLILRFVHALGVGFEVLNHLFLFLSSTFIFLCLVFPCVLYYILELRDVSRLSVFKHVVEYCVFKLVDHSQYFQCISVFKLLSIVLKRLLSMQIVEHKQVLITFVDLSQTEQQKIVKLFVLLNHAEKRL